MLEPSPDMAIYQLSNPRVEHDRFNEPIGVFDWLLMRPGQGRVRIAARTENGRVNIAFGSSIRGASGTEKYKQIFDFFNGKTKWIEFWAESEGPDNRYFMHSNSIQFGVGADPPLKPRPMADVDRADWMEFQLENNPPEQVPNGYMRPANGSVCAPGMPIIAGWRGQWEKAELVAVDHNVWAVVRYPEHDDTIVNRPISKWIAATPQTLAMARSNPNRFSPSVLLVPGTRLYVDRNAKPVSELPSVPLGMPVQCVYHGTLLDGFIASTSGEKLFIRKPGTPSSRDVPINRDQIFARPIDARKARSRVAAEAYLENVILSDDNVEEIPQRTFPVVAELPGGYQLAPMDKPINIGTEMMVSSSGEWQKVMALSDSTADTAWVPVRFEGEHRARDYRVLRKELLIAQRDLVMATRLRHAEGKVPPARAEPDPRQREIRTWKDASGKFSVEATLERVVNEVVTLKTPEGRVIQIPIEQLSTEDRTVIKQR
ncbi:SHD1 domain-containing protein [Rubripirellula reticaptiva]|nr:SHD1 domain-containing protein [Rubripirellula reticaptiva]